MDPDVAQSLGGSQRSQVEAAVVERTKQLNRLFEEQVKKQYEAMKREVTKLAKAHQKDVQGLDERFKMKMAGLAARFAQIEAEEARIRNLEQENVDMKAEIEALTATVAEKEAELEASGEEVRRRDERIEALLQELTEQRNSHGAQEKQQREREREHEALRLQMESAVADLERQLDRKRADLVTMQKRLVNAKSTYDSEVVRKQEEVAEMEGSLLALQTHTCKMADYAGQVQEQIAQREADMKVQLGLMKNTVAYALYIDESLQVDLTDPQTTKLLVDPVVVSPSGVTYSRETVQGLLERALKTGQPATCPVSGQPLQSFAENHVVASILARYAFKQQLTRDVMVALEDFQQKTPLGEEDQPLEKYVQRMKQTMAQRLEDAHQEDLAKAKAGLTQELELRTIELTDASSSASQLDAELQKVRSALDAATKDNLASKAAHESALGCVRDDLHAAKEEVATLRAKNGELLTQVTDLTAKLTGLEEEAADDAEPLGVETTNPRVLRVRKAEVIALQAQLSRLQTTLDEERATALSGSDAIDAVREELSASQRELAAQQKMSLSLAAEREALQQRLTEMQGEQASMQADMVRAVDGLEATRKQMKDLQELLQEKSRRITELELQLKRLEVDGDKLRSRLEAKETANREAQASAVQMQAALDESLGDAKRSERALALAREQGLEAKQEAIELERQRAQLEAQKSQLEATLKKKQVEVAAFAQRCTKAEAIAGMLEQRLTAAGKGGSASLEMRPLVDVQRQAGVFDPIKQLPNVPVLEELTATIQEATGTLEADRALISKMTEVKALDVDASLPEEKGQPAAPAPAGEAPSDAVVAPAAAVPSSPLATPQAESAQKAEESGAGQLVLAGSAARPTTPAKPSQELEPTALA